MITRKDRTALTALKRRLKKRTPLQRIVLFGSRARGDHDPDSDMDVLVILDDGADASSRRTVSDCAWETSLEQGVLVVPVVYSRHDWEDGPERSSLLAQAIDAEGITV